MFNRTLFREMSHLQREMDSLFRGFSFVPLPERPTPAGARIDRGLRINLRQDSDNYFLEALLPGTDAEKLDIKVVGKTLTLSGERAAVETDPGAVWHRRERGRGAFLRSIELPLEVDAGNIKAEYRDGLLRIGLPKAEAAKPKRIAVKGG